ncbi:MAG: hypothetical protein ACJAUH_002752, partial [Saprospiraceae bacterium]
DKQKDVKCKMIFHPTKLSGINKIRKGKAKNIFILL